MSTAVDAVSENAPPVCLWKENPYRLVSLWNMILEYAKIFLNLTHLLDQLEILGKHFPSDVPKEQQDQWNESCLESLRTGRTACDHLNLKMSRLYITNAIDDFRTHGLPYLVSTGRIAELDKILRNELDEVRFFHVPDLKVDYCDAQALFGVEVKERFPSAQFLISRKQETATR